MFQIYPQVLITFIFFLTPSPTQMEGINYTDQMEGITSTAQLQGITPTAQIEGITSPSTAQMEGDECAKAAGELCGGDLELFGKCASGLKCNFESNAGICLKEEEKGCKCNGLVLEVSGNYIGDCSTTWDGKAFCYVNKMNTTCQDLKPSYKAENLFWSFEACKNKV
eukprot:GFUD01016202.1.p1 GENE.GFUD01016202.1~~GFUD01016202.1.p1  ORF type:complete len:167 (+),score=47.59 GFUD01016202.1:1-501(+)